MINMVCNGREYDECLLPLIGATCYEDELSDLPAAPDVSNYLTPEVQIDVRLNFKYFQFNKILNICYFFFLVIQEDTSVYNGNRDSLCFDGMADVEVEKRLKVSKHSTSINISGHI